MNYVLDEQLAGHKGIKKGAVVETGLPKILFFPKIPIERQAQFIESLLAQNCISFASERTDCGQARTFLTQEMSRKNSSSLLLFPIY
jgi:hypothetical protein